MLTVLVDCSWLCVYDGFVRSGRPHRSFGMSFDAKDLKMICGAVEMAIKSAARMQARKESPDSVKSQYALEEAALQALRVKINADLVAAQKK